MDRLEQLGTSLSEITAYDIKSYWAAAKAAVMNYSEMETKVREATNDDPWGASSTLMKEIAQGTFNFQEFNEIMPTIYKRFTEKEAREWRQIYKALQLLEFLIKHGSERVIDDARAHISMIKILRNFHYIDDKGKDQGINVRNRAKEIAELLSDLDRVRQERRKAKTTRNKYVGTGNDGGASFSSGGGRYGGFSSDAYFGSGNGGGSGADDDYGRDRYGGAGSGSRSGGGGGGDDFEEYDAGEWDDRREPRRANSRDVPSRSSTTTSRKTADKPVEAPKAKAKEVDLFSMDDEEEVPAAAPVPPPAAVKTAAPVGLDDDFDDFQSAPGATVSPTSSAVASPPASSAAKPNFFDMLATNNTSSTAAPPRPATNVPAQYQQHKPAQPSFGSGGSANFFGNAPASSGPNYTSPMSPSSTTSRPPISSSSSFATPSTKPTSPAASTTSNSANFDDLFSFGSMAGMGNKSNATSGGQQNVSMAAMAKQQSSASIWGAAGGAQQGQAKPAGGAGSGGFGNFGASSGGSSNAQNGGDDLLL